MMRVTKPDQPIIAADSAAAEEGAKLILRFFAEALRPSGQATVEGFLAADFVDHDPDPEAGPGREGVVAKLAGFWRAFPDGRFVPEIVVAAGDLVSVRSRFIGTQTGPLGALPPSGKQVEVTFHDFYRLSGGRIAEHWHVFDAAGMMAQLGAR